MLIKYILTKHTNNILKDSESIEGDPTII